MLTAGFVLPQGVAGGLTGLAFVEAFSLSRPRVKITIFGDSSLSSLVKFTHSWVDIDLSDPRESMRSVLAHKELDTCIDLGGDFFGESIAVVASSQPSLLGGLSPHGSALERWSQELEVVTDTFLPNWNREHRENGPEIILIPGRTSSKVWADDEWPEDNYVELANSLQLENISVGVVALQDSATALALARIPDVQVIPDDLPLTTLAGILSASRATVGSDEGIGTLGALLGSPSLLIQPHGNGERWFSRPNLFVKVEPDHNQSLAAIEVTSVIGILKRLQVPLAYY